MFKSISEYMYYLLHTPLKRIKGQSNQFKILFNILGQKADETKEYFNKMRLENNITSCSKEMLLVHGNDRGMQKYANESDEDYRKRLLLKTEISERAGSRRGVQLAVQALGHNNVRIIPFYKRDKKRWAEFIILIEHTIDEEFFQNYAAIRKEVRAIKEGIAKDNYEIVLKGGYEQNIKSNIPRLEMISCFYPLSGYKVINLNGTWLLDNSKELKGWEIGNKELYRLDITIKPSVKENIETKSTLTTYKNWWLLDGKNLLNGNKTLGASTSTITNL